MRNGLNVTYRRTYQLLDRFKVVQYFILHVNLNGLFWICRYFNHEIDGHNCHLLVWLSIHVPSCRHKQNEIWTIKFIESRNSIFDQLCDFSTSYFCYLLRRHLLQKNRFSRDLNLSFNKPTDHNGVKGLLSSAIPKASFARVPFLSQNNNRLFVTAHSLSARSNSVDELKTPFDRLTLPQLLM